RQVVAAFGHELDGPGVDAPRRAGAGAVRLDALAAMEPGEGLGHLAAVAVLDADEEDAPRRGDNRGHAHDSFAATLQNGLSWTHRQVSTAIPAPSGGAVR